jgi:hypothetical protein
VDVIDDHQVIVRQIDTIAGVSPSSQRKFAARAVYLSGASIETSDHRVTAS